MKTRFLNPMRATLVAAMALLIASCGQQAKKDDAQAAARPQRRVPCPAQARPSPRRSMQNGPKATRRRPAWA
ncbi:MAG: hypothetical protein ACLGHK_00700 [Alphaproteobacteria bacterium]